MDVTLNTDALKAINLLNTMILLIKKGWTQKVMARNKRGREVKVESPSAVSFCLLGAYIKANPHYDPEADCVVTNSINNALEIHHKEEEFCWDDWNDAKGRTQQDIIALLTEAKKLIRKEAV